MKDKKPKKSITIGGLKLQIEENPKKIENKHKKFFIHLVNRLVSIQERTDKIFTEYGLNLIMYEDLYFQVIEDMVYEHYDVEVGEVIFWYVNGAKLNDEDQYIEDKKTGKKYKAKTPLQVYNVCKKLKLFKN
jgi:NTP pyrophosphatase (non-canonical NTP hydrolase)